jgi:chemotaxis protein histidine kinase CheA
MPKVFPTIMTENNKNDPVEKLLQLQQIFKRKLPNKISDIESSWKDLRSKKSPDFNDLHLKIHSLIGSAATFGASRISIAPPSPSYLKKILK